MLKCVKTFAHIGNYPYLCTLKRRHQHTPAHCTPTAAMVELVDTRDLKSLDPKRSCGFESRSRHYYLSMMIMRFLHNYILPLLFIPTLLLSVSSCGSGSYDVNIDGHLLHMNQGQFLVFSPDGAIAAIDTITVTGGRFNYQTDLRHDGTLVIVFPNFKTLAVFVERGNDIDIDGDASQLKDVDVKGTKLNEEFTKWRKEMSSKPDKEMQKSARQYVRANPESPISRWMRMKYLREEDHPAIGEPLPKFTTVDIDGNLVTHDLLTNGNTLIVVWSSWNYDSQNAVRRAANIMRESNGQKLSHTIAICLDAEVSKCRSMRRSQNTDNVTHICDGKMLDSPLLKTFGLSTFPANILVRNGIVRERNIPTAKFNSI